MESTSVAFSWYNASQDPQKHLARYQHEFTTSTIIGNHQARSRCRSYIISDSHLHLLIYQGFAALPSQEHLLSNACIHQLTSHLQLVNLCIGRHAKQIFPEGNDNITWGKRSGPSAKIL